MTTWQGSSKLSIVKGHGKASPQALAVITEAMNRLYQKQYEVVDTCTEYGDIIPEDNNKSSTIL